MGSPIWVLDLLQYVWCHFTTYLPPCPSGAYAVLRLKNGRTKVILVEPRCVLLRAQRGWHTFVRTASSPPGSHSHETWAALQQHQRADRLAAAV
jgi:hypothetical protein